MKQTRWLSEFSCLSENIRLYPHFSIHCLQNLHFIPQLQVTLQTMETMAIHTMMMKAMVVELVSCSTVKAPNIVHLSLLTSFGYNKKETKLKKCAQPNKVIIIYHLQRVQMKKKSRSLATFI